MTEEEKKQFETMQTDIGSIKQKMEKVEKNVAEMYVAIMGSTITGDGGMVKRLVLQELENEAIRKEMREIQARFDKELQEMKIEYAKSNTRLGVIWVMAGALGMALLKFIFS